jgi:hypothetical protein
MDGHKRPLPTEELVNQKIGEAIGKIGETVFPLRVPLVPQQPNPRIVDFIINRSAWNYGIHADKKTSYKTWEGEVIREETRLLEARKQPRSVDPERIF